MSEESRFRFTKPAGKRYVDMCIEFDNEFYGPDRDDDKLFCYVFLLFKMFAYKSNYFRDREDYDQYAMFAASTVYMRYIRKWARGERIKSVLNYVKKVKGPLKVTYQNENFAQIFDPERDNKTDGDGMKRWHHEYVMRQFDAEMTAEEKNAISHRGAALRQFRQRLEEYLSAGGTGEAADEAKAE